MSAKPTTPPQPPSTVEAKTPGIEESNLRTQDLPRCERCAAIDYLASWARVAERLAEGRTARRRLPKLTPRSRDRFIAAVTDALATGALDAASARAMLYAAQLVAAEPKRH